MTPEARWIGRAGAMVVAAGRNTPGSSSPRTWHVFNLNSPSPLAGKPDQVWTVGPVSNANGTPSATETVGGATWIWQSRQHALNVANNVAIDVTACSENRSDPQSGSAVNIAHQILAKVPE